MRIAFLGDGTLGHVRRWAGFFHESGHDVLLLSFEDVSGCPFPSVRIRKPLPTKLAGYTAALGKVKRELASFRPDIVNAIYAGGYGFIGALSGFRPLVVSVIGSDMLVDYPSSLVHRLQIEHALRNASLVTTDAEILSKRVENAGVEPSRIVEVYFGIDPGVFNMDGRTGGQGGVLTIVSTRNLYPVYDIGTLLDAFAAVRAGARSRLVVCGDGPLLSSLEKRAGDLGIAGDVRFEGRLDPEGIASRLRGADIYVSTARSDSTSVSLLEAMACGAVPVVTDLEANREWVRDGAGGILFRPGDARSLAQAILGLGGDRSTAESMRAESAAAVAERGLWRPNMEKARREFERLLSGETAAR